MSTTEDIRGGVHKNTQHDSAIKHVVGGAVFIDDMPNLPETQEVALLLSPHAHAKILTIDTSKACLLYTSPSPRDRQKSRMPSSA